MKNIKLFICCLLLVTSAFAKDPVHWTYIAKKLNDKNYELHITATIEKGWHLYSQNQPKDAIALPTSLQLKPNPIVIPIGKWDETGKKEVYKNETIGVMQYQYSNQIEFIHKIQLKNSSRTNVSVKVTYQVCTDEKCLNPQTVSFNLKLE
ncbi:MAG: protein-disulfide reductase DsbD domain-containing protein [Bacteroidota bacterium]